MSFLQPTVQTPKSSSQYKKIYFEVPVQDIHPLDQIEFHKQVGEMIYSIMTTKAMSAQKLQNTLVNVRDQLKQEKASSYAKDTRIKSLEDLVIELGYDPQNIKAIEELIKNKNVDIAALKKQLNLPPTEHPQAKEVLQYSNKKYEMMSLILQLTAKIKEMEIEMDKLVQEKESNKAQEVLATMIPVVTTVVPSTLAESMAPNVPMATTVPVTSSTTSTT